MKRFVQSAAGLLLFAAGAGAQENSAFFKPPIFVFQPGIVTANAVSPTVKDADVLSGLNVRFMTILPTAAKYFLGVAGVQFQPNGVGGNKNNSPGFFYGGLIPVPIVSTATQGWLSFSLDPLGVYGPSGYSSDHPYSHEAFLEGAFVLNVGSKMMKDIPMFAGVSAYFLVDQQLTHPAQDAQGKNDRWNPVLLYGVTVPIAAPK
ncbi:MAG TPA: hypothetical protein VKA84_21280 [Gemmatimonadaceae bacterium]|nr:hypothetical protein [Gemmatimonadaceae bacterium]